MEKQQRLREYEAIESELEDALERLDLTPSTTMDERKQSLFAQIEPVCIQPLHGTGSVLLLPATVAKRIEQYLLLVTKQKELSGECQNMRRQLNERTEELRVSLHGQAGEGLGS